MGQTNHLVEIADDLRGLVKSSRNREWMEARFDRGLSKEQAAAELGGDPEGRERAAFREMLAWGLPPKEGCEGVAPREGGGHGKSRD